jgi:pectin methylesterase-like acyl-CoA thioesterase
VRPRLAIPALLVLCLCFSAFAAPSFAAKGGKKKQAGTKTFEVCKRGCRYRTIQKAVDAAGSFEAKKGNAKIKAVVTIRPGKYVEGVVVDGTLKKKDFDGLTIEGAKKNRRKVILEGKNAKGELGAAQNGIEAISVDGVVLRNIWARNYQSNGFFVHASGEGGQHCDGYTMDNLLASGNRSYGLFAKNCYGGKMVNSAGYHQGDSAFYVGETPCDSKA